VLLELPAILTGLWLYRRFTAGGQQRDDNAVPLWQETLGSVAVSFTRLLQPVKPPIKEREA
jgi:hypothetical protein